MRDWRPLLESLEGWCGFVDVGSALGGGCELAALLMEAPTNSLIRVSISGSREDSAGVVRSVCARLRSLVRVAASAASARSAVNLRSCTPIHDAAVLETGGPGSTTEDDDDAELRRTDEPSEASLPMAWAFR